VPPAYKTIKLAHKTDKTMLYERARDMAGHVSQAMKQASREAPSCTPPCWSVALGAKPARKKPAVGPSAVIIGAQYCRYVGQCVRRSDFIALFVPIKKLQLPSV
jgi:hypothetical protein